MDAAAIGFFLSALLMAHVLHHSAAALQPQPRGVHLEDGVKEDTAVAYSNNFYMKIVSESPPLHSLKNLTSTTQRTIEAARTQNSKHFPKFSLKAQTSSSSSFPKKSKSRNKYDEKKFRQSLGLLVKQLRTRDEATATVTAVPENTSRAPFSADTGQILLNDHKEGKVLIFVKEFIMDEKTTEEEKNIEVEHYPTLTDTKNRTSGRPERKKFKSEGNQASYVGNNLGSKISEKRMLSKMLPDTDAGKNLNNFNGSPIFKAPDLKAHSFLNTTSPSAAKKKRTAQKGYQLESQILGNSSERGVNGNITNHDSPVKDPEFAISAQKYIMAPQSSVESAGLLFASPLRADFSKAESHAVTDAFGSDVIASLKSSRTENKNSQQPYNNESESGASHQSVFDEIQSENANYLSDDIHTNEHRPTVENHIITFDEYKDTQEVHVPSTIMLQESHEVDDVIIEDSADILVPDGDIADSEALKEVQYSKHSVEAMRARLLAIMALHKGLCEQAAAEDPPDWQGCRRAWDQVLCWPPAEPSSLSSLPCPGHVPGMDDREGKATRWCDETGNWENSPHTVKPGPSTPEPRMYSKEAYSTQFSASKSETFGHESTTSNTIQKNSPPSSNQPAFVTSVTNSPAGPNDMSSARTTRSSPLISSKPSIPQHFSDGWTNYTLCLATPRKPARKVSPLIAQWLPVVSSISVVGYSISLSSLALSCAILLFFKRLRCARNLLHLHLFVSFSLRAVAVLLKTSLISQASVSAAGIYDLDEEISSDGWACRLKVAVWEYFIIANYSWFLMEGLYLHNLIFRALFTDSSAVTHYVLLGWGLPLIVIVGWSIARVLVDNSHCWLVHFSPWPHWVGLRLPVAVSVFLNLFFFVNIVRVLASKLRSPVSNNNGKFKKLSRSTLVLVPLFGIHYCLLWGLSLSSHPPVELAWLLLDQVCSSFQGLVVSVLYCFLNGEVQQELRKVYGRATNEDDFGPLGTSYSTVLSRAKASMASVHGSSDRALHSSPPTTAPNTPPRLNKNNSEGFLSLHSVPEERLEMQLYNSSDPIPAHFKRCSVSSFDLNCENLGREIGACIVLNIDEPGSNGTSTDGQMLKKMSRKICSTSFMPTSENENSSAKSPCRALINRGHNVKKQKSPLGKKLSFQEPIKGLPFIGEILNSGNTRKCDSLGSANSSISGNLEEISELSALLPVHNSMSSATLTNRSLADDEHLTETKDLQPPPQTNPRLCIANCNGTSSPNHSKKLMNGRGETHSHSFN